MSIRSAEITDYENVSNFQLLSVSVPLKGTLLFITS